MGRRFFASAGDAASAEDVVQGGVCCNMRELSRKRNGMSLPVVILFIAVRVVFAPVFLLDDLLLQGWVVFNGNYVAVAIRRGNWSVELHHWELMLGWALVWWAIWAFWPRRERKDIIDHLIGSDEKPL